MLEVNVWLPTPYRFGKRIKHGIFGPWLASEERGENVGHANFILLVNERSKIYAELETDTRGLVVKKSLAIIPETRFGEKGLYHAPKTVKSLQIDYSFWPVVPPAHNSILKDVLHLMHLGKGSERVMPQCSTHSSDMRREGTGAKTSNIQHQQYHVNMAVLGKETQENRELESEIKTLRSNLQNKISWENKLNESLEKKSRLETEQEKLFKTYQLDRVELKKEITQTSNKFNENKKKMLFLTQKLSYSTSISTPHHKTLDEINSGKKQLLNLETEQQQLEPLLNELKKNLVQLQQEYEDKKKIGQKELNHTIEMITDLQKWIQNSIEKINNRDEKTLTLLEEKYQQKEDMIKRKEHVLNKTYETTGLHPDHSISLPTSESGLRFFIDEVAVVAAMQKEKDEKYSLLFNNCVSSAKRCLIAGIEHLKNDLKGNGLPESLFEIQTVETCKGFRRWAKQLEKELIKLNSSPEMNPVLINPISP